MHFASYMHGTLRHKLNALPRTFISPRALIAHSKAQRRLSACFSTSSIANMPPKEKYTDPDLRDEIKEEVKAGDKGGKPGQWSARKVLSSPPFQHLLDPPLFGTTD